MQTDAVRKVSDEFVLPVKLYDEPAAVSHIIPIFDISRIPSHKRLDTAEINTVHDALFM